MQLLSLALLAGAASAAAIAEPQMAGPPCNYNIKKFLAVKEKANPEAHIQFSLEYVCDAAPPEGRAICDYKSKNGSTYYDATGSCASPYTAFTFNFEQEGDGDFLLTLKHPGHSGSKTLPRSDFVFFEMAPIQYGYYKGPRNFIIDDSK